MTQMRPQRPLQATLPSFDSRHSPKCGGSGLRVRAPSIWPDGAAVVGSAQRSSAHGRVGMGEVTRRLAGILAADVVGYSAMVGADEPGTLARVRALRADVVEPLAAAHEGRVFKTTGDGFLADFASAVQALRCAIAIQDALRAQGDGLRLRIGVHQGEVVPEGDDLLGDGVIVAARLEPLAEPGGICISARVREDAAGKLALDVEDLGEPELKNIAQPVRVFRVRLGAPERPALALPDKPSLAVLPFQNMSGDPEQEYFADGMVEDITTALSRIGWLFVIARNSRLHLQGRARSMCARSGASLACATCWKAACARPAGGCASPAS